MPEWLPPVLAGSCAGITLTTAVKVRGWLRRARRQGYEQAVVELAHSRPVVFSLN